MVGISAYGVYVPARRMPLAMLTGAPAKEGGPEKAIAWSDEDSVTMAVEAARNCLKGIDRSGIDMLLFATTSYAFSEKQGAAIIAKVLSLDPAVRAADISHSLKSGTQALLMAVDAVAAGQANKVLVIAADCRMGTPGSGLDNHGGDAGVALLVSSENVLATIEDSVSLSNELVDVWRRDGDRFVHNWEDRFVVEHGYLENAGSAAKQLLQKQGLKPEKLDMVVLSAANNRSHKTLATKLGVNSFLRDSLIGRVGSCGTAHAFLQLAGALDEIDQGDLILLVNYGDGADALLLKANQARSANALEDAIASRIPVKSIEQYRKARGLVVSEYEDFDFQGISATIHFRERDENLSLEGHVCSCGSHQFPKERVCIRCGGIDKWASNACYAEKTAKVKAYSFDYFSPSPEPPTAVTIVEVDDGPRIYMQMAEVNQEQVDIDMPVSFVFRRIHQVGNRPNYFWKCCPLGAVQ
jgi:hydroxymethylglutaryl-CoA synthase